jgi:hypothetical protein
VTAASRCGRHLRQRTADAFRFVAHVFQAVDALDHALLVVRLDDAFGLLRFALQLLDAVADFVRGIAQGLLGFTDGLLNMSESLLDFVCLQHDVLLCFDGSLPHPLRMRDWRSMIDLSTRRRRTNRTAEQPISAINCHRIYRI